MAQFTMDTSLSYSASELHPNVTLVLGGGGARGFAHIGVLKVLQQEAIPIDFIVGASVGSIVGALYAFDLSIDHLEKTAKQLRRGNFLSFDPCRFWQGYSNGKHLEEFIANYTDHADFKDLKIPFASVCVNLQTGELTPISQGALAPAVHASAALPGLFQPVKLHDRYFIDSGAVSPCPVEVAKTYHSHLTIAVGIPPDPCYNRSLPHHVFKTCLHFELLREQRLTWLDASMADITIVPDLQNHGILDFKNSEFLIKAGEKAALEKLSQLKNLINV